PGWSRPGCWAARADAVSTPTTELGSDRPRKRFASRLRGGMSRLTLALAFLALACSAPVSVVPLGERSSATQLHFEAGSTEATGQLLAFDPKRHTLDISIELPLEQPDDIEIFIVP